MGGTWMSPILFIDFAMWINPTFKVKVLKFVYDEMIKYRNEAGDAYKELASAVQTIVPRDYMRTAMQRIGEALNYVVFGAHRPDIRNEYGEESKQRELCQLEIKVASLIKEGFIRDFDKVITYLRNQYIYKFEPKCFNARANYITR